LFEARAITIGSGGHRSRDDANDGWGAVQFAFGRRVTELTPEVSGGLARRRFRATADRPDVGRRRRSLVRSRDDRTAAAGARRPSSDAND